MGSYAENPIYHWNVLVLVSENGRIISGERDEEVQRGLSGNEVCEASIAIVDVKRANKSFSGQLGERNVKQFPKVLERKHESCYLKNESIIYATKVI